MATEVEKTILRKNLEKYEGKVSHMYLDSKGYVTVGVGHLLSTLTDAQKLAFKNGNKPATKDEIKTDPSEVRLALFDMIFNLGMPNLRSWTKFNAAIKAKDWKKAAGVTPAPKSSMPARSSGTGSRCSPGWC